jgi:hypothetical protein
MFRMFQVLQAHVAGVMLQGDAALKAYVASLCFNCFKCSEIMLQVLQAHVAGVVFTNVATTILYMFQQ